MQFVLLAATLIASTPMPLGPPKTASATSYITGLGVSEEGDRMVRFNSFPKECTGNRGGWIYGTRNDPQRPWELLPTLYLNGDEVTYTVYVWGSECRSLRSVQTSRRGGTE